MLHTADRAQARERYQALRARHPVFTYEGYRTEVRPDGLVVGQRFRLAPDLVFTPRIVIAGLDTDRLAGLPGTVLDAVAFQLGMAELFSYWKAACSPRIHVAAGALDDTELAWWQDLLTHGMAEFFWRNGVLDELQRGPVTWQADGPWHPPVDRDQAPAGPRAPGGPGHPDSPRALHLLSGGKDSAAGLAVLEHAGRSLRLLLVNPTSSAQAVAEAAGHPAVVVRRRIDPGLLALNDAGYLNGHTPFSSYLAVLGWAVAVLTGADEVVTANTTSDEAPNVAEHGVVVNHQYSKTLAFEQAFAAYLERSLGGRVRYYSAVRPLDELATVGVLARRPELLARISSCDAAPATERWCRRCHKCLSTFVLLAGVAGAAQASALLGADLLAEPALEPRLADLLAPEGERPWQCTATPEEIAAALRRIAAADGAERHPLVARGLALAEAGGVGPRPAVDWQQRGRTPDEIVAALRSLAA